MRLDLLLEGILIGIVVAVPVGPLGLLCVSRALMMGPLYGMLSGFGVATADSLAAGIAALGISLISGFLADYQTLLRLFGGIFLFCLGVSMFRTRPEDATGAQRGQRFDRRVRHDICFDVHQSGDDSFVRGNLCRLACAKLAGQLLGCRVFDLGRISRLGALVGGIIHWADRVPRALKLGIPTPGASGRRGGDSRFRSYGAVERCRQIFQLGGALMAFHHENPALPWASLPRAFRKKQQRFHGS